MDTSSSSGLEKFPAASYPGSVSGLLAADKSRALQHYGRLASRYHEHVQRGLLAPLRRRERRIVLELACLEPGLTLADVGCGAGFYALEAKRRGLAVCAVDAAPEMVAAVASHVEHASLGDVESLKIARTFDRVICAGVLDFVCDPQRALANLARLVDKGGRLVLLTPCAGVGGWLYRLEKRLAGLRVNLFEPDWLRAQLARHGLRVEELRRPLPGNLALAAVRT